MPSPFQLLPPPPPPSPMDEVLREICVLQYGLGEEEASLIEEIEDLDDPHGSDWFQPESADDNFQEYLRLQDVTEMKKDMEEWEYNEATHEYFANGGKPKVSLPVVLTNTGEKYSQGFANMERYSFRTSLSTTSAPSSTGASLSSRGSKKLVGIK